MYTTPKITYDGKDVTCFFTSFQLTGGGGFKLEPEPLHGYDGYRVTVEQENGVEILIFEGLPLQPKVNKFDRFFDRSLLIELDDLLVRLSDDWEDRLSQDEDGRFFNAGDDRLGVLRHAVNMCNERPTVEVT